MSCGEREPARTGWETGCVPPPHSVGDISLLARNQPSWKYLPHGIRQALQATAPAVLLLNIHQHTTVYVTGF